MSYELAFCSQGIGLGWQVSNPGVQYNKEYNFSMEPSGFVIPVYTSMGYSYKQQQLFHKNKIQLTKENESPTTL